MNNIFQKNNILIRGLLNTTYNFLQKTYNQSRNVFTTASAWGQILFVLENLSQLILYFIEDSITELNIYEATRDYSVRSLARIAGYDPARAMAAQGEVAVSWNLKSTDVGGGAVIIQENTRIQCEQNGLAYTLMINGPRVKVSLTRGTAFKFKTIQGAFSTTTFTGTGNALQSFNVPVKGGVFLDQFNVKVSINDNRWKQYSSLYDIPLEGQGYLVMSGINEGIDIYFGNSNFGKVPPPGSFIKVEYLQTSGSLGNLRSTATSKITYKFLDQGTDLFGKAVNLNDYLQIVNTVDPSFGADEEPIAITRLAAPKTSRAFVFANAANYEIYLQKFNIFSQIQAFSTFDDEYLDDDNVVYLYLVPDVTVGLTSNEDYFSIPISSFLLTSAQKLAILNLIEDSGSMIATTVVKIVEPRISRYVGNAIITTFEGFDPEIIKDKIQEMVSTYFINLKRRDKIPRSDMIALIESVPGVDSVSFYFVGQENEAYHATIDSLPNTSVSELNTNIGFDEFGDIIIGRGELVVIRGGWNDRYGSFYEVGIVPGKPSALNISIKGIVPVTYLSELGAETKAQLIAANK
jgi:hypothetical protein